MHKFTDLSVVFTFTLGIIFLIAVDQTSGANVLVAAPFFATSHTKVVQAVTLNLAKRGHHVTAITSNPIKEAMPNYREILIDFSDYLKEAELRSIWPFRNHSIIERINYSWRETLVVNNIVLKSKSFMDFINNDKSRYDVVIVEMFYEEIMYMFSHRYKAPIILLETTSLKRQTEDIMGNPFPVSYVPYEFFHYAGPLKFLERLHNWFIHTYEYLGRKYYYFPKLNELAKISFASYPKPLPTIEDLERNVTLILTNTHYSIDTVMPLVPGVIQIGGVHIEPAKPLPKDIKKFLDDAVHGAIVFTMGTHTPISTMEGCKMNALLKVFSGLKQRVIMKWENDNPPKIPNIMTLKFLPQNDILAHPNVKAFITHGGMLGIQEAITYGIPVIGIPIFADQYINVQRLVHLGAALELDLLKISEFTVNQTIDQIINNPKYREMALELSSRFRERPMKPLETAMYWIEYVIKFKGTQFLKSPLVDLPWYVYRMIDVALLVFIIPLYILVRLLRSMKKKLTVFFNRWRRSSVSKAHKKKNK